MIRFLLNGVLVMLCAYLLPGVHVEHYGYALLAALVLSGANLIIRPLLILLTLPVTLITFGIFLLVINAVVIMIVSAVSPGFSVDGFWWALLFSLLLSVFNSMIKDLSPKQND
ncbi:MAG: phage holin family protein [Bacteroidetes bacterium]|nr:phage holin family protein [Bacteroidota bacterium]